MWCADGAGMHLAAEATTVCTVFVSLPAGEPPTSARSLTCSSPSVDSCTFWLCSRWHILPVGNTCRCYPPPGTRETIHPSYQSTARTRCTLPCALPASDSRFVSHSYAQAVATPMEADGGEARPFGSQPAAEAWQPWPAHLCGRFHALPAGCGRRLVVPRSVAPLGVCRRGGFCMRAVRTGDPVGLCRWSRVFHGVLGPNESVHLHQA